MEETTKQAGLVDAANRVARELLRTPRFKEGVKIVLNSLDPESVPELVRTLVWEDADISLSLVGSLPEILDIAFIALRELVAQLGNFSPDMLADFLGQVIEGLDGEALGEALGSLALLLSEMSQAPGGRVARGGSELGLAISRGFVKARYPGEEVEGFSLAAAALPAVGKAVKGVAAAAAVEGSPAREAVLAYAEDLAGAIRDNPGLAREVAGPVVEAWQAVNKGVA